MKAVHVLSGIDGFENALGVDLRREGKLDENAVNGVIVVQVTNEAQHLVGGDGGERRVHPTGEAELLAGGDLGFDVQLRGGIFAGEDRSQAGTNAFAVEAGNFAFQFREDFVANFRSVEYSCCHFGIIAWRKLPNGRRKPAVHAISGLNGSYRGMPHMQGVL